MKHPRRRCVLFAALAVSACTVSPPPVAPPPLNAPIPPRWQASTDREASVDTQWWQRFGDAGLSALIVEAQRHNHDLRAAAARMQAAAVQAELAGVALQPTLDLRLDASRQRQNFIGLPIPGTGGTLTRTFTQLGVSLSTSWEIDLWGRLRAGQRAAVAELQAAEHELRGARQSLAAQTAKAYWALVETSQQIALADETEQLFALTAARVEDRVVNGVRPVLDLQLAQASLAASRAGGAAQRERQARARRQLEALLGRYPRGLLAAPEQLPALPEPPPVGLPAALLCRRPDVQAAERRLAATGQRVEAARAALFPSLGLTASAGTASGALEDLVDPDFYVWQLAAGLVQPLLTNGRRQKDVELARARAGEAAAAYARTALTAYTEVESALAAEAFLRQRASALLEAERRAVEARTTAEQRYQRGLSDLLAVLDAQRRALDAAGQRIAVQRALLDTRVDLHLALGGGFEPPPPPTGDDAHAVEE